MGFNDDGTPLVRRGSYMDHAKNFPEAPFGARPVQRPYVRDAEISGSHSVPSNEAKKEEHVGASLLILLGYGLGVATCAVGLALRGAM